MRCSVDNWSKAILSNGIRSRVNVPNDNKSKVNLPNENRTSVKLWYYNWSKVYLPNDYRSKVKLLNGYWPTVGVMVIGQKSICQMTIGQRPLALENVLVFELQSIWIIDCSLAIWWIESKFWKMTKAIQISEFIKNCLINAVNWFHEKKLNWITFSIV